MNGSLRKLLETAYSSETADLIEEGLCSKSVTFRANLLKTSREEICAAFSGYGIRLSTPDWCEYAFIAENASEDVIRKTDEYKTGKIYLQSLSSMIPPLLLEPESRDSILDMCAAPGGKTTQIAAICPGAAITACEKNKIRAERLRFNLERQGAGRVNLMVCDSRRLDGMFKFDKILLDAPCSGSGTLTDGGEDFSEELYLRIISTQTELIKKAMSLLRPGGRLVYSTCSVLPNENCEQVKKAIGMGAKVVPIDPDRFKGVPTLPTEIPGVICIRPTERYEGFFAASLERG